MEISISGPEAPQSYKPFVEDWKTTHGFDKNCKLHISYIFIWLYRFILITLYKRIHVHTSLSCLSSRIHWFLSFASAFSRLCGLVLPALPMTVWCFEDFWKSFVAALHFPKSMQIETHFFFQSHFLWRITSQSLGPMIATWHRSMCDMGCEMCRVPLAANLHEERQIHTHVVLAVSGFLRCP